MDENKKLAFDFARDTTKQLITLSTAIVALSVTFSKDVFGTPSEFQSFLIVSSWVLFLVSIFFGVWTLAALTATAYARALAASTGRGPEAKFLNRLHSKV